MAISIARSRQISTFSVLYVLHPKFQRNINKSEGIKNEFKLKRQIDRETGSNPHSTIQYILNFFEFLSSVKL